MKPYSAILLGLLTLSASAHPTADSHLHSRALADLTQYANKIGSSYVRAADIPADIKKLAVSDYVQSATNLVKGLFPGATFRLVGDHYTADNGLSFVNFKQTANGHDIDDANFNVNVNPDGSIFSYGHSFFSGTTPSGAILSLVGLIEPVAALTKITTTLGLPLTLNKATATGSSGAITINNVDGVLTPLKADLVYVQNPSDKKLLIPTWRVETNVGEAWLLTYLNALGTGQIHAVTNYVAHVTYNVIQYPDASPDVSGQTFVRNPENYTASPKGWLNDGSRSFTVTEGNNALSYYAPQGVRTSGLTVPKPQLVNGAFNYYYNQGQAQPSQYTNASVVQLFYTVNKIHDILYLLGFNEVSGNFQYSNFGKNTAGQGDYVDIQVQDGTGNNNAYFSTPVDGRIPTMAMFVFTNTNPPRDSAFDLDIVFHEYAHGLSNRLTGGPGNSGCLQSVESRGLGEGWSDFYGYAARINYYDNRYTNYAAGAWAYGKAQGSRPYLYSNSFATNPQTYSYLNRYNEVHDIGSVWASILYGVTWDLIDELGNTLSTDYPRFVNGVPTDGRYFAMKVILEGMRLQPCNPTFLQARDAIIDADNRGTGGKNYCVLWSGFSFRGLGTGATYTNGQYIDNYDVPVTCGAEHKRRRG